MTQINLSARFAAVATLSVVAAVCMTLSGCASRGATTLKLKPPVDLLQDCASAEYPISTNADLVLAILAERKALALCNNDKAALREWAKD